MKTYHLTEAGLEAKRTKLKAYHAEAKRKRELMAAVEKELLNISNALNMLLMRCNEEEGTLKVEIQMLRNIVQEAMT